MREGIIQRLLAKFKLNSHSDTISLHIGELKSLSHKYPGIPPPDTKLSGLLLAAAWLAHDVYAEDMPQIATELLERGVDTPSLRRLAGETNVSCSADVEELVAKMFRELGVPYPLSERQANLIVTRQIAREVIAGERDPKRAGNDIEIATWNWNADIEDLNTLFALNDEMTWDPEYQRFVTLITDEMLDVFARLSSVTDREIFA
jgi:hypothetical protein